MRSTEQQNSNRPIQQLSKQKYTLFSKERLTSHNKTIRIFFINLGTHNYLFLSCSQGRTSISREWSTISERETQEITQYLFNDSVILLNKLLIMHCNQRVKLIQFVH